MRTYQTLLSRFGYSMTINDVAVVLKMDKNSVYRKIYDEHLPFKFTPRPRRASTANVAKYLDGEYNG